MTVRGGTRSPRRWRTHASDRIARVFDGAIGRWRVARRQPHVARMRLRERELQAFADHTPDIIARFDARLRHVFVNAAVRKATGRTHAEFIGKTNRELGMPSEHCEIWDAAIHAVFATACARSLEFAFPAPDGERHYAARLLPELGPTGAVEFVLVITQDVTETKRVELALRASEARLQAMADSMPQLVWRAGPDGTAHYFNARLASYTGAARRADGAWAWQRMIHADDLARTEVAWQIACSSRLPYTWEHRLQMADGSYRWHLTRANPTYDETARLTWHGTSTDIHDRVETEAQVADALQRSREAVLARDSLISLVSHDLKNPLSVMTLTVTTLQMLLGERGGVAPGVLVHIVDRMARQATRMSRLIDELLDVAQLRAGALELARLPTDLVELARAIAEEWQLSAPNHQVVLQAHAPELVGHWDPLRVARVVDNLISNAIKYSPDGGRVQVDLDAAGDRDARWAIIRVEDHGIGIATADLGRVFEWFSRGENATRTTIPGTGIGLAGARDIVALHGGSISVQSEEHRGSTFTVRLPM